MFVLHSCVVLPWILWAWAAADPVCDPRTQYLRHGQCCQMCRPGTSMRSSDCRDPVCQECEEGDYTDTYNTESVCERQPYCDHNQNFLRPEHRSKTQRDQCLCKPGFHCSSSSCISCVPHKECGPGEGAKSTGGQNQDTVCEKCLPGTFSDETSWSSPCKNMTECAAGYEPQGGSTESDHECVFNRGHVGVISSVFGVIGLLVIGAGIFLYCRRKRQTGHFPLKKEADTNGLYVDRFIKEEEEEEKKPPFVTTPSEDEDTEQSFVRPAQESSLPESSVHSVPQESEYPPTMTDRGQELCQDQKEHVIPIEETGQSHIQAI